MENIIGFEDFQKLDLRVARVLEAERIEGSEKLLKLKVSLGSEERQIIAGIGKQYSPEDIVGKFIVVVANLEPKKLMGHESQGMVLAASDESNLALIIPDKEINPGSRVK